MWVSSDNGRLVNLKYSRAITVGEGKKERFTRDGNSEIEYCAVPGSGFVVISHNGSKSVLAHRPSQAECERVMAEIREALRRGDKIFDVRGVE